MDHFPGSYPQSEPPTPDVNSHQTQYQYQDTQDARVPTKPLGPGLTEPSGLRAQQQEHRYNEPISQAIPAVEGGEIQSHRDDTFSAEPSQQLGNSGRLEQQGQPRVHTYAKPKSQAVPAVLGAQGQAHREWPLRESNFQPQETKGHGGSHHEEVAQDKNTPYWGSLPTAAKGGIYNSVTGHPRDDHDQHHGLPERTIKHEVDVVDSTANRSTSQHQHQNPSGTGSGVVGTGIYNTVIGHGSQDEHAKQHESSGLGASHPSMTTTTTTTTSPSSFYGSQDNKSDSSHTGRNVAAGAGVGAAAVAGSRALQEHPTTTPSQSFGQSAGLSSAPAQSTQAEHGTQRVFPLTSSGHESHPEVSNTHSRAKEGLAAGAATGAGVGAYEYAQGHRGDVQPQATQGTHATQANHPTQTTQAPIAHRTHNATTTSAATQSQPRHRTSPSPEAKVSRSRSGSKSEKQHHGLLSHAKVAEDERGHRKLAKDPPADIAPAVMAARRASVHRKRNSLSREPEDTRALVAPKNDTESRHGKTAGGLLLHSSPADHQHYRATETGAHREPNASREGQSPSVTRDSNYREAEHHQGDSQHGRAVGTGAAIGAGALAASEVAHKRQGSSPSQAEHGTTATGTTGTTGTTSHSASSSSPERSLPQGYSNTHNTATGDALPYNTLASGTPSGVSTGSHAQEHQEQGSQSHGPEGVAQGESDRHFDSKVGRNMAAGAGTGAAAVAGARAIQEHQHHTADETVRVSPSAGTQKAVDSGPVHQQTYSNTTTTGTDRQPDSHLSRDLATGAGAGAAAYAGSRAIHNHGASESQQKSLGDPAFTQPSHHAEQTSARDTTTSSPSSQYTNRTDAFGSSSSKSHGFNQLASGTPSGGAPSSSPGQVGFGSQERDSGSYDNTASGLAAGAGAGAVAYGGYRAVQEHHVPDTDRYTTAGLAGQDASQYITTQGAHTSEGHSGSSDPSPYNVLPSGTPSGVNIEYKRRSKELARDY